MTLESSKERARQLFVDRSTMGLDSADESELRQLLLQQPTLESEDLELAAAAVALAAAQADLQDLPSGLYDRLERQGQSLEPPADDGFGAAPSPVVELKSWRRAVASPWLGLATAATLLLSLGWYFRYANTPIETQCMLSKVPVLAQAQEREELLQAADVRTAVWQTATGTSGDLAEIEGEIVWSSLRQEGVVHLEGLAEQLPHELHLWIVDPAAGPLPIDGGTFRVDDSGDVTVALELRGKDQVRPSRFVLTFEDPETPADPAHLEPILVASLDDPFVSTGSGA